MPQQAQPTAQSVLSAVTVSHAPQVFLSRIQDIRTVEVMITELNQVEDAASEEKTALGFFTLCLGALGSALSGIPSPDAGVARWAFYPDLYL